MREKDCAGEREKRGRGGQRTNEGEQKKEQVSKRERGRREQERK